MPAPQAGSGRGTVYTIGHSTRELTEFLDLLKRHGVQQLVDVRRFPGSRRNPQFGAAALSEALSAAGIRYLHLVEMGGRRGRPDPGSPNAGWRVAQFQAYADWMARPEWRAALHTLEALCARAPTAVMCSEAVPWRCHRRLISDALVAAGWEVQHIVGPNRLDRHEIPPFAKILGDGRIIYPGEG